MKVQKFLPWDNSSVTNYKAWAQGFGDAMAAIGWVLVVTAAGVMGANHVIASLGLNATPIVIALVSVWALLRAIDFIAKGSTYRLFVAEPAPAVPTTTVATPTPAASSGKPMAAM